MSGKGSSFEREISVALSLWVSDGKRDDLFWRSQASGARFTQRKKSGKDTANQAGDIAATDPEGEFLTGIWSIELKTGYGKKAKKGVIRWDALDLLDSQQSIPVILKMWEQCSRDAGLTNRQPVLIFRRNLRSSCIVIRREYCNHLRSTFGRYTDIRIDINGENNLSIFPFKKFTEWIHTPQLIT